MRLLPACLVGFALLAACGGGAAKERASSTARLAGRAILDVESSGAEIAALPAALDDANSWLGPVETAIGLWDEVGDSAYERVAPCLGAALTALRRVLIDAGVDVPLTLEQAEEQLHDAGRSGCVREPR